MLSMAKGINESQPKNRYSIVSRLAWHILFKLTPDFKRYKLFIHCHIFARNECSSTLSQEQFSYLPERSHVIDFLLSALVRLSLNRSSLRISSYL